MAGEELDAMIAQLRALGRLPEDVAREAQPLVLEAARATARAGTTPEGRPWPPTKKGTAPLKNAADAITVEVSGRVITEVLTGPEVFHNAGVGSTTPQRKIIPETGDPIPPGVQKAILQGARRAFEKAVR